MRPLPRIAALLLLSVAGASGCRSNVAPSPRPAPSAKTGQTTINEPAKLTSIESGKLDGLGRPIRVACVTCHATRTVDAGGFPTSTAELHDFHKGLTFSHGSLECQSCHVGKRGGEPRLHLADGTELATSDTMRLCAQCHGPKYQTYLHGGHGGMTGSWDLSRGGRTRNHCVDCHDPHVPKFQPSHPVLPPKDRLLVAPADDEGTVEPHG